MGDEENQTRSKEEIGLSDTCPCCGGDADIPEVLQRAASMPKARIADDGTCSHCHEFIDLKYRGNFCCHCGATFISPQEIAAGKLNRA